MKAPALFERLQARERKFVVVAAWVIGLALLWSVGLAPALKTIKQAPLEAISLKQTLANVRADSEELQRLQKNKTTALTAQQIQTRIEQVLQGQAQNLALQAQGTKLHLNAMQVSPQHVSELLRILSQELRSKVETAELTRTGDTWTIALSVQLSQGK